MLQRLSTMALLAGIFISLGLAQISDPPQDDQHDPDDPNPPLAMPLRVGNITSSGINYHALVPKDGGTFDIVNLGSLQASVLLLTTGSDQIVKQVEIQPGEKRTISGEYFGDDVLVVSLQAFKVFTATPIKTAGKFSQEPIVNPPSRPVRIAAVRMLDGTVRPVAITEDNKAYYPVYIHRQPIGEWSPNRKGLLTDHGVILDEVHFK